MSENIFWNNFIKLCNEHKKKPNPVAKELGISSGSVTGWKNGAYPRDTSIKKIADYFGVSVEHLTEKSNDKEKEFHVTSMSDIDKELYSLLKKSSPKLRKEALKYIKYLADSEDKQ
ncbi:MAG: helix-turn-helix transcriptional regulator [Clostridiales bacterium]|nr:helix-turn-helix transcriptional regulator [Clostridiales bacterium]